MLHPQRSLLCSGSSMPPVIELEILTLLYNVVFGFELVFCSELQLLVFIHVLLLLFRSFSLNIVHFEMVTSNKYICC